MKITRCKQPAPSRIQRIISELYLTLSRNALQKGECAIIEDVGEEDALAVSMALNSLFLTPIMQDGKLYLYRTHDVRVHDSQPLVDKTAQIEAWLGYNPYSQPWIYNPLTNAIKRKDSPATGEYEVSFGQAAQFMLGQIDKPRESRNGGGLGLYIGVGGVVWGMKDETVREFDMMVPDDWERVSQDVYLAYLLSEEL